MARSMALISYLKVASSLYLLFKLQLYRMLFPFSFFKRIYNNINIYDIMYMIFNVKESFQILLQNASYGTP